MSDHLHASIRHTLINEVLHVQVGVSLVLSFMVVWDLPTISRGVSSLQTSRLAPIYNEVAPSVAVFGQLFGKALQAQVRSTQAVIRTLPSSLLEAQAPQAAVLGANAVWFCEDGCDHGLVWAVSWKNSMHAARLSMGVSPPWTEQGPAEFSEAKTIWRALQHASLTSAGSRSVFSVADKGGIRGSVKRSISLSTN